MTASSVGMVTSRRRNVYDHMTAGRSESRRLVGGTGEASGRARCARSVLDDVQVLAAEPVLRVLQRVPAYIRFYQPRQRVLDQRNDRVIVHDHLGGLREEL